MKILVFEYITGGGFNRQALPKSLAQEGGLMIQALLDDLAMVKGAQVHVMIDYRCIELLTAYDKQFSYTILNEQDKAIAVFSSLLEDYQYIWPIAPETDDILFNLSKIVEQSSATLLNSSAEAVTIAGNKLQTSRLLNQNHISSVKTEYEPTNIVGKQLVRKPIDGVGCEQSCLIDKAAARSKGYIYQEYMTGYSLSLSCLFKQGEAWLISINKQDVALIEHHFVFQGCQVNIAPINDRYQQLVQAIASVLPGLWGYVGIDLIVNGDDITVLEINPRLTTSYVGIFQATGINVAQQVIQLLNNEPSINFKENKVIDVNVNGGYLNVA